MFSKPKAYHFQMFTLKSITTQKEKFTFADKYRASYSLSIPEVQTYYNLTGYGDKLLWAASWLYHATGDQSYLEYVLQNGNKYANFGSPTWFCWDKKLAGTQLGHGDFSATNTKVGRMVNTLAVDNEAKQTIEGAGLLLSMH
ncbi:hypothetical protein ACJRO7_017036 [Eucalyptus globulus]|uniref:cellulase n=1 Tax=Eucalyptus globulus TaxID=34317 RepID=A0ABD3KT82_EUCGL